VDWIRTDAVSGPLRWAAASYLGVCGRIIEWWEAAGVIAKFLLSGTVEQGAAIAVLDIVRGFVADRTITDRVDKFVGAVVDVIAEGWNREPRDQLLSATAVSVIAIISQNQVAGDDDLLFNQKLIISWTQVEDRMDQFVVGDQPFDWRTPVEPRQPPDTDWINALVAISDPLVPRKVLIVEAPVESRPEEESAEATAEVKSAEAPIEQEPTEVPIEKQVVEGSQALNAQDAAPQEATGAEPTEVKPEGSAEPDSVAQPEAATAAAPSAPINPASAPVNEPAPALEIPPFPALEVPPFPEEAPPAAEVPEKVVETPAGAAQEDGSVPK
jgi:hypothetical protein